MQRELEQQLKNSFPQLFVEMYGDPMVTCMARGCECEDGWFGLIQQLSEGIAEELRQHPDPAFRFEQVKEKFGSLEVYVKPRTNERIVAILREAEVKSKTTCELCGAEGSELYQLPPSRFQTLCKSCSSKSGGKPFSFNRPQKIAETPDGAK